MISAHCSRWLCMVLVFAFGMAGSPLPAEDEKPPAAAALDLKAFSQLPVRFNGRVTTYDVVARNYLRRFGGRDVCYDQNGREHPAAHWLLDVMAQSNQADHWRIFKIENEKLLEQLKLEPHKDAPQTRQYFSLAELKDQFTTIEDKTREAQFETTAETIAARNLFNQLRFYLSLEASLRPPSRLDANDVAGVVNRFGMLSRQPLPRFVPAASDGGGATWSLYFSAGLTEIIADGERIKQNPHFQQLQALLKAHKNADANAFQQGVEKFAQSLKAIHAAKCPFRFTPGPVWLEHGVESSRELFFYADANAAGQQVVDMSLLEAEEARFIVNHFQNQKVSSAELVNSWRISLGLVPLAEAELKNTWKPTQIDGRSAILIDAQTPDYVDLPERKRFVTAVLQEEGHTFVFSFYGEKGIVARSLEAHRELMKSFQLGSPKELAEWFPAEGDAPEVPSRQLLAAVVPDGKRVWIFVVSGFDNELENHREKILAFLKSVKLTQTETGQTQLEWQLPENWAKIGEYGEATLLLGKDQNALPMMITPLGEASDQTLHALVGLWATAINAGPLSEKERNDRIQEIQVSDRKAYLVELRSKTPPKEKAATENALVHKAPQGWKEGPAGVLRQAYYEIGQGEKAATVSLIALPVGSQLAANINRWRQQIDLPSQEDEDVLKATKPVTIDKHQGTLVDLHNPQAKKRILAAVVEQGDQTWFFKMMGEETVVEQERENFNALLKSVEFSKPQNPAPGKNPER